MTQRGFLITFEGGEGTGKSTQISLLASFLEENQIPHVCTREPGGSPGAELIRDLLLQGESARWDPLTEYLLLSAARRDHLVRTVKPALNQGTWVLCDRFIDSSRVYQGRVQHLSSSFIEFIYEAIAEGLEPDLTLVLDLSAQEGLRRANERNSHENRFEKKGTAFHDQIRTAFLDLAKRHAARCHVLDGDQPVQALQHLIQNLVTEKLIKGAPS